jgi:acyl-CoA synthetase (AMP-forming)/AMP-acid ligase II
LDEDVIRVAFAGGDEDGFGEPFVAGGGGLEDGGGAEVVFGAVDGEAGGEALEAVAIGVPDPRLGQTIMVIVRGDPANEAALRDRLRRDLPNFMQPAQFEWRDDLPRNANGKLDRAGLRAAMLSRQAPAALGEEKA